jgi:Queuine/archaeosine tRNA-ribosyltransferase
MELTVGAKSLPLPIYFPSISSVKTALRPQEYLQLLSLLPGLNDQFLVSAFDLADLESSSEAQQTLASANLAGIVTLMDSGNYESFWKNAQADWKQANFHKILADFPCDFAFSFDEQTPPTNTDDHVALIVERWQADQTAAGRCQIIPIVHASANELPELCAAVASRTSATILAVPERRLGDGILERASTLKAIRAALNELGRYIILHLLGTGNPTSIALYSAIGADSFDGLEWCQTVVDHESGLLYHLSQADFFAGQTAWGMDDKLSFQVRTLAHNLEFFSDWMQRLRDAINQDRLSEFCRSNLPLRAFRHLATIAGWSQP